MKSLRPLLMSLALAASAPAAFASTTTNFGFACYTSNTPGNGCSSYAGQLSLQVIDNANGTVGFKFINNIASVFSGDAARITAIYFDLAGITAMVPGATVGTVAYGADTPIGSPPASTGWNAAATDFQFAPIRTSNPNVNAATNSIQAGESIVFVGTLGNGFTYANLIAGFNTNTPPNAANRIGFHLQSVGTNSAESESLYAVPSTTVVPVPGALPMMLGGLLGLGCFARRRKA